MPESLFLHESYMVYAYFQIRKIKKKNASLELQCVSLKLYRNTVNNSVDCFHITSEKGYELEFIFSSAK